MTCECGRKLEKDDFLKLVELGYPPNEAVEVISAPNKILNKDYVVRECCKKNYVGIIKELLKK